MKAYHPGVQSLEGRALTAAIHPGPPPSPIHTPVVETAPVAAPAPVTTGK